MKFGGNVKETGFRHGRSPGGTARWQPDGGPGLSSPEDSDERGEAAAAMSRRFGKNPGSLSERRPTGFAEVTRLSPATHRVQRLGILSDCQGASLLPIPMPGPESLSRRSFRRWLIAAAALLFAGPLAAFAWRHRPLDPEERRLIGTWEDSLGLKSTGSRILFRSDRRYCTVPGPSSLCGVVDCGDWSIQDGRLTMMGDVSLADRWRATQGLLNGSGWQMPRMTIGRYVRFPTADEMYWELIEGYQSSDDEHLVRISEGRAP